MWPQRLGVLRAHTSAVSSLRVASATGRRLAQSHRPRNSSPHPPGLAEIGDNGRPLGAMGDNSGSFVGPALPVGPAELPALPPGLGGATLGPAPS